MKRFSLLLLIPALLWGAEPSAEDQAAVQQVFRKYLKAVNDCDEAGARGVVTDFVAYAPGLNPLFNRRLNPKSADCGDNRVRYELSAIARIFAMATPDVILSDAYFRTIQLPGGDKAGRAYLVFVKRENEWKLINLRLHSHAFEKPFYEIVPSKNHVAPGPDGWVRLFDGTSTDAFMDIGGGEFPTTWRVEDSTLRAVAGRPPRGLRTRDTYNSFELRFEWKSPPKGNSGVKYHLFYLNSGAGSDGAGHEYQVADDEGDPGAIQFPVERSGSLYNQFAPKGAKPKPLGEFNESAIIVRGRHCEHWLNGIKVVEYETGSGPLEGPILLQHHTTDMWFRNIRIKRLD